MLSGDRETATFEPQCLPTALHAMCHTDPARACKVLLDNFPAIAVMPNLLKISYMKGELREAEGMPCLRVDEDKGRVYFDTSKNFEEELSSFYEKYLAEDLDAFAITFECDPGFHSMLEVLKRQRPPELKIIKFQITGPITFTMKYVDEKNKPIFYNEELREAVIKALIMKVKWQENKLHEAFPGVETMLQIAEPFMGMYGSAFVAIKREEFLASVNEVIGATEGLTFIHCCANTDWPLLMESKVDAINFDAYEYADRIALYPKEIKSYLEKGGMLAWGIVPTSDEKIMRETPDTLLERLEASMEFMIREGIDKELLLKRALITPSCVTSTMTIPLAEKVYIYTNMVARTIRYRHFKYIDNT